MYACAYRIAYYDTTTKTDNKHSKGSNRISGGLDKSFSVHRETILRNSILLSRLGGCEGSNYCLRARRAENHSIEENRWKCRDCQVDRMFIQFVSVSQK